MQKIGEKITEIRKKKGLTQEDLSNRAKINLRTLQRIEKGESEPRGHTLCSLCQVLDVNIEEILDYGKEENKNFIVLFHLSSVFGMCIPLGDILIPFILWITKKDKVKGLETQGKNLLNFRIIWNCLFYILAIGYTYSKIKNLSNNPLEPVDVSFGYLGIVIPILFNILYPSVIAILINKKGSDRLYYPNCIRIIK